MLFERAVKLAPENSGYLYNLATAQFEANQLDDAQDTLSDIHAEFLDRENRIKVHYLRARLDERRLLPLEAARYRLDILFNPGFTAPIFSAVPNVTVFHDLQHRRYPRGL